MVKMFSEETSGWRIPWMREQKAHAFHSSSLPTAWGSTFGGGGGAVKRSKITDPPL